jgi:hypothetical protein
MAFAHVAVLAASAITAHKVASTSNNDLQLRVMCVAPFLGYWTTNRLSCQAERL